MSEKPIGTWKWRETQKLSAPVDQRELQAQAICGKVLDAVTLRSLYEERERSANRCKKVRKQQARMPAKVLKSLKGKQVRLEVLDDESASNDTYDLLIDTEDSGAELEGWEDGLNVDMSNTSIQSVISMAIPNGRPSASLPMVTSSTPVPLTLTSQFLSAM